MESGGDSKVLILITKGVLGGAQSFVLSLAEGLQSAGVAVTVAFGEGNFLSEKCALHNIPTHSLKTLQRTLNPIKNIQAIFEVRTLIKKGNYDVLHINSSNALFAALSAKLCARPPKVVFTFHGLSLLEKTARVSIVVKGIYWVVVKTLLFFVDEVVFVSDANKKRAQELHIASNGVVIYNSINGAAMNFLDSHTARTEMEKKSGVYLENSFIIGSVGRLSDEKNYEFLVRGLKDIVDQVPFAQLVLIGDGPQKAHLEKVSEELGLREHVVFLGEIVDAYRLLKGFNVFVLTSRYEGMPVSILEALEAGIPVLSSDVGGVREQLPHASIQTFAQGDMRMFQDKLVALASDTALSDMLAEANYLRTKELFSYDMMITQYQNVYGVATHS